MRFPFLTNYIQLANGVITIITIVIYGFLYFSKKEDAVEHTWYFLLTLPICGIPCIFIICKWNSWSDFKQKIYLAFSFGIITLCGIAAKILLIAMTNGDLLIFLDTFALFNFVTFAFSIPALLASKTFKLSYRASYCWTVPGVVLYIFSIVFLKDHYFESEHYWLSTFIHVYYAFVTASIIDLFAALGGGIMSNYTDVPTRRRPTRRRKPDAYKGSSTSMDMKNYQSSQAPIQTQNFNEEDDVSENDSHTEGCECPICILENADEGIDILLELEEFSDP